MENYSILIGQNQMRIQDIKELLSQTYWAHQNSIETIQKSLAHSLSFGILDTSRQKQIACTCYYGLCHSLLYRRCDCR